MYKEKKKKKGKKENGSGHKERLNITLEVRSDAKHQRLFASDLKGYYSFLMLLHHPPAPPNKVNATYMESKSLRVTFRNDKHCSKHCKRTKDNIPTVSNNKQRGRIPSAVIVPPPDLNRQRGYSFGLGDKTLENK